MNSTLVINGLPDRIRLDGWWLSSEFDSHTEKPQGRAENQLEMECARHRKLSALMVLCMVALADWLFWHHSLGASVAIFSCLLSIAMVLARAKRATLKDWIAVVGITIVANLPILEQIQPISLMFSMLGVVVVASWVMMGTLAGWWQNLVAFLRVTTLGPVLADRGLACALRGAQTGAGLGKQAASLALPLVLGAVFIAFFVSANPLLERLMGDLATVDFITFGAVLRVLFWLVVAAFVWPYLNLPRFWVRPRKRTGFDPTVAPQQLNMVVNPVSVRTSLILFNCIFALQTGLDMLVLLGGLALPEGVSYASYAHRGAYPLMATALLAGTFAIGTRKLVRKDKLMRGLVYVWLLQNLFLVLSAAFRLSRYVEAYALTYLRISAFIWMFLVFIGLVLVAIQISRDKGNFWLMSQNLIALLVVLYISSFANFAPMIARYNILHPLGNGKVDAGYICSLGPEVLPVIRAQPRGFCPPNTMPKITPLDGWRDWGFRKARLAGYLVPKLQTGSQ